MANRTKITEARARAFAPADGRESVLWDSAARGPGLRVRANGRKTWIVHRRGNGSVVKRTLGAFDALTVEDARHAARALLDEAATGGASAVVPTVRTFAPAFLADCAERWKPETRGKLRAYRAALDTARVRQPPGRYDRREGRAQLA